MTIKTAVSVNDGKRQGLQESAAEAALEAAAVNMRRSIEALRPALASVPFPVSPSMVQGLQETENAWRSIEQQFGLLDGAEVGALLGSKARGRSSYAADKRKAGQLIGIKRRNSLLYPGFQFGQQRGEVREVIPALIGIIRQFERSEDDLAQWLCDPSGYLDGGRPVDYLDEPGKVLAAAEGHYGVQW